MFKQCILLYFKCVIYHFMGFIRRKKAGIWIERLNIGISTIKRCLPSPLCICEMIAAMRYAFQQCRSSSSSSDLARFHLCNEFHSLKWISAPTELDCHLKMSTFLLHCALNQIHLKRANRSKKPLETALKQRQQFFSCYVNAMLISFNSKMPLCVSVDLCIFFLTHRLVNEICSSFDTFTRRCFFYTHTLFFSSVQSIVLHSLIMKICMRARLSIKWSSILRNNKKKEEKMNRKRHQVMG